MLSKKKKSHAQKAALIHMVGYVVFLKLIADTRLLD
jgi:uncharacterized membrane protein (DUF485 family)